MEDTFDRNCKQYGGIFSAEEQRASQSPSLHGRVKAFHRKVREAKCAKGVRRPQRKSKIELDS